MKLAHVAIVTPHRCGLYETTRELVAAERALGHDARMFDPAPTPYHPKEDEDRGAVIVRDREWLKEADVIVDHSGCDGTTDKLETPHILVAHGRPHHSFVGEVRGGAPVFSYHYRLDSTPKYKAVVTFWNQHVGHLKFMFRQKPVYCVPAPVDLSEWKASGPGGYGFHGKKGAYNVVIADAWRDDGDLLDAVIAVGLAARILPGIKLHIYGKRGGEKGWPAIFKVLQDEGTLGEVQGWVSGLDNVYRAADMLVTPHQIDTRAVREAQACGCTVFRAQGMLDLMAKFIADDLQKPRRDREAERKWAAQAFNPLTTAKSFLEIARRACC